jgi:hypothetical protein
LIYNSLKNIYPVFYEGLNAFSPSNCKNYEDLNAFSFSNRKNYEGLNTFSPLVIDEITAIRAVLTPQNIGKCTLFDVFRYDYGVIRRFFA